MRNILIHGDNFDGLTFLVHDKKIQGKVKLIYIDPPFGTQQDFTFFGERGSTISRMNGGKVAYNDHLTGEEYLEFLSGRLTLMHQLLASDGSIYLHIDSKMGHYVKVLMDKIFGAHNFVNDITRIKCNPKNFTRKAYGNVKDMILFYAKTPKHTFNDPRQEIVITATDKRFRQVDENGRRFTTTPLHAPGETLSGETGKQWRGMLPPVGRHWRYGPKALEQLDKRGLVYWSATGNPRKKIYADDVMKAGMKMQDIWTFKDPQNPQYPTEKNMAMLELIVKTSSNESDIVLDAFAGSGTTLVAAQTLKRRFIGIDQSKQAIIICKDRLTDFEFLAIKQQQKPYESMVEVYA